MLVVTNGFVTTIAGIRVSARSPLPAFAGAVVCLAAWLVAAHRARAFVEDFRRIDAGLDAHVRWVATAIATLAAGTALAFNSFSATGSDASGYLSEAEMLLDGTLERHEPLASIAKWADGEATLAPLGWRATEHGQQVPTYAIGLPLLLAPLHAAGGAPAASSLIPLTLGLAIVVIAALAHRVAGYTAAIVAAVWLATSPVALVESMQVMSDVPVTAAWMLCWWLLFGKRTAAAGVVAAVAVLIRPNIAPVAAIPALYILVTRAAFRPARVRVAAFAVPVAIAGAVTAYLQWRWFGSPLRSGYGAANEIYVWANVAPNISSYGRWLLDTHGPWMLAAPLALFLRSRELVFLFAFAAVTIAAYLPYAQFDVWTYLRFLLPALAVAMVAAAALVAAALARVPAAWRVTLLAAVVVAIAGTNIAAAKRYDVFRFADRHVRARVVGERLAALLPVNAAIVSGEQSGSMRYYTRRTIVRWDLMDEAAMRDALEWLTLNGYQVWVVLDDWEEELFRRRLPTLAAITLDYEPVVESRSGVGIRMRAWRARRFIARSSNNE